jgi:hypothetical protein
MEIAVIKIPTATLQKLHDSNVIKRGDYEVNEVYEKGFKEDPEYQKLIAKKIELFREFKKKEKEIENLINDLRDEYNKQS